MIDAGVGVGVRSQFNPHNGLAQPRLAEITFVGLMHASHPHSSHITYQKWSFPNNDGIGYWAGASTSFGADMENHRAFPAVAALFAYSEGIDANVDSLLNISSITTRCFAFLVL
jgi:hypothetical protein